MAMNELIKEKRKALNLTQEEVAKALGVSATAVYKWEKGSTYPDITLLPPLARLFKIDLNTLFAFNEELSDKEIADFVNRLTQWIYDEDYEKAFALGLEKIREYPTFDELTLNVAVILQGAMALSRDEIEGTGKIKEYEKAIENLYQKAAESQKTNINQRAKQYLISLYMGRGEYERAQSYLDRLPPVTTDSKPIQASLYIKQNRREEGLQLVEEMLLASGTQANINIITLLAETLKEKQLDKARYYAKKLDLLAQIFETGPYNHYMGYLMIAIEEKNIEDTLSLMEKILESFKTSWTMDESPLYGRLLKKEKKEDKQMDWPSFFLKGFEADEDLDFLRENEGYKQLIDRYSKKGK